MAIAHSLGRPFILIHLDIENLRMAPVAISRLEAYLEKVSGDGRRHEKVWACPIRVYLPDAGDPQGLSGTLFIGTLRLDARKAWSQVVRGAQRTPDNVKEEAQAIKDASAMYIASTLQARAKTDNSDRSWINIPEDFVAKAIKITEENLTLSKGEYHLYLDARDGRDRFIGGQNLRFHLYESNIQNMRQILEGYKYGFGLSEQTNLYTFSTEVDLLPVSIAQGKLETEITELH